jgi:hypothetical protein
MRGKWGLRFDWGVGGAFEVLTAALTHLPERVYLPDTVSCSRFPPAVVAAMVVREPRTPT